MPLEPHSERPLLLELSDGDGGTNTEPAPSSGAFFPEAQNFVISGGHFTNHITNNVTSSSPTIPADFRKVPLGDLDLLHEIRLDGGVRATKVAEEAAAKITELQNQSDKAYDNGLNIIPAQELREASGSSFIQYGALPPPHPTLTSQAGRKADLTNQLQTAKDKIKELQKIIDSREQITENTAPEIERGPYCIRNKATNCDLTLYAEWDNPTSPVTTFHTRGILRNRVVCLPSRKFESISNVRLHLMRDSAGRPILARIEWKFFRAPRYVNPGPVLAPGEKNIVHLLKPGYYFISTDLTSNPPSVMMDPNGPSPVPSADV
ncbi:hypothetical protein B0H10DRAFT_2216674 [Mycena sp. CBHHK59/15]|nr:hypothetical protein B0H10DRAFT_2216674 [Mycena sp. CBHHK59/15]